MVLETLNHTLKHTDITYRSLLKKTHLKENKRKGKQKLKEAKIKRSNNKTKQKSK